MSQQVSEATDAVLLVDYQETLAVWRQLVEIRFKLLALVPVTTAAGIGLAGEDLNYGTAAVGVVAIAFLLGIVMYDLRNTIFYDSAIHRAKELERLLQLPRLNGLGLDGGLFGERPRGEISLAGVKVWHDRALRWTYSVSIGAWGMLSSRALAEEWISGSTEAVRWAVGAAGGVAFVGAALRSMAVYAREWKARRQRMGVRGSGSVVAAVRRLAIEADSIAPDGSEVRLLAQLPTAGLANFRLPAGATSEAVEHLTVGELWFVVSGFGEMWLSSEGSEFVETLEPGVSVAIPVGTRFQFRAFDGADLSIVGATIPPWPTNRTEAVPSPTQKWPSGQPTARPA